MASTPAPYTSGYGVTNDPEELDDSKAPNMSSAVGAPATAAPSTPAPYTPPPNPNVGTPDPSMMAPAAGPTPTAPAPSPAPYVPPAPSVTPPPTSPSGVGTSAATPVAPVTVPAPTASTPTDQTPAGITPGITGVFDPTQGDTQMAGTVNGPTPAATGSGDSLLDAYNAQYGAMNQNTPGYQSLAQWLGTLPIVNGQSVLPSTAPAPYVAPTTTATPPTGPATDVGTPSTVTPAAGISDTISPATPATDTGTPSTVATPATIAASTATPAPSATPANSTTLNPSTAAPSDILNQLLTGVSGSGAGSAVSDATQAATLAQLANPNPYQSAAVQAQETAGESTLNEQAHAAQQQLDEYLASRGISDSSVAGGYYGDLAGQEANAQAQLQSGILSNEANLQLAGTGQAINQGNTTSTTEQSAVQSWLNSLIGYGQQGFNNDVTTQTVNQNAENAYQNELLQLLLAGYSGGTTA